MNPPHWIGQLWLKIRRASNGMGRLAAQMPLTHPGAKAWILSVHPGSQSQQWGWEGHIPKAALHIRILSKTFVQALHGSYLTFIFIIILRSRPHTYQEFCSTAWENNSLFRDTMRWASALCSRVPWILGRQEARLLAAYRNWEHNHRRCALSMGCKARV